MERGRDFLAKRAPFYLAGVALLVVFVVPPLLEKDLADFIPDDATIQQVLEYTGPNDTGISMADALESKIESVWSGPVYDHKSTNVQAEVIPLETDMYRVTLTFESQGQQLDYDWNINVATGQVRGNNDITKDAVDLVDFYD